MYDILYAAVLGAVVLARRRVYGRMAALYICVVHKHACVYTPSLHQSYMITFLNCILAFIVGSHLKSITTLMKYILNTNTITITRYSIICIDFIRIFSILLVYMNTQVTLACGIRLCYLSRKKVLPHKSYSGPRLSVISFPFTTVCPGTTVRLRTKVSWRFEYCNSAP